MTKCKLIDDYIAAIRSGATRAPEEIHLAMDLIERKLSDPDVVIDCAAADKAVELIERYFKLKLFPWELLVVGLVHCYYQSDDTP